jgi:hypothetical protein
MSQDPTPERPLTPREMAKRRWSTVSQAEKDKHMAKMRRASKRAAKARREGK